MLIINNPGAEGGASGALCCGGGGAYGIRSSESSGVNGSGHNPDGLFYI